MSNIHAVEVIGVLRGTLMVDVGEATDPVKLINEMLSTGKVTAEDLVGDQEVRFKVPVGDGVSAELWLPDEQPEVIHLSSRYLGEDETTENDK